MATFDNFAGPAPTLYEGLANFLYDITTFPSLALLTESPFVVVWDLQTPPGPLEYEGAFYVVRDGVEETSPVYSGAAYHRREGILGRAGIPPSYYISTKRGSVLEVLQNTPRNIYVFMRALDTGAGLAGLAPTMVVTASKNGGAGVVITPTITDLSSTLGVGWYLIALTGPHLDTLGEMAFHITALAALPNDDVLLNVIAIDKQDGVRAGLTALPDEPVGTPDGLPTAEMVSNIAVTSAALNKTAASRLITTGTESGVLADANTLDNVFHTITAVGGAIDFYYEFDVSAIPSAVGVSAGWKGYFNSTPYQIPAYAWNWTSLAWDQVGTIPASNDTVVYGADFSLTNSHTSAGIVRIRFANTGIAGAVFATDRILMGYAVLPATATDIATSQAAIIAAMPSAATIRDAILDALRSGHVVPGSIGEGIAIATSLLQGNFYMDNVTNTANGQTAARLRCFHTGAATSGATPGGTGQGEFATFLVATSYSGPNKIVDHRVVQQ